MRHNIEGEEDKLAIVAKVKELKHQFEIELCRNLQYYLPVDNKLLKYLQILCPKKFVLEGTNVTGISPYFGGPYI